MKIQEYIILAPHTGFKIGGPARYFCIAESDEDVKSAIEFSQKQNCPFIVLGLGNNVLISDEGFEGLIIKIELKGVNFEQDREQVIATVAAGENWDEFSKVCCDKGFWGAENLSHIPGACGALAIQNVGAYGQEASQIIESVKVLDTTDLTIKILSNTDCQFRYRKSIFNSEQRGRYVILELAFKLQTKPAPNLTYADVKKYFAARTVDNPSLMEIRAAIIEIRNSKFTLPQIIPNAGSFFKNLLVDENDYLALEKRIGSELDKGATDKLKSFKERSEPGKPIKISTALLIDACGLKGLEHGNVKVNPTQPLVILNHTGKATAKEVLELMQIVRKTVYQKTGSVIYPEPEFVGFRKDMLDQYMKLD